MFNVLRKLCVLLLLSTVAPLWADIPQEFVGEWSTKLEHHAGFPYWFEIPFSAHLWITREGLTTVNHCGDEMKALAHYDDELEALIIHFWGFTKSGWDINPFTRVSVDGEHLVGEVWQHKPRFRWIGTKVRGLSSESGAQSSKNPEAQVRCGEIHSTKGHVLNIRVPCVKAECFPNSGGATELR